MKLITLLLVATMAAATQAAGPPEDKERATRRGMKVKIPKGGKEKIKGIDKFPWGMYPLWRVHKYKGVSLRPVPIGGVPLPPPPVIPAAFPPMPVALPPMPFPASFPPAFPPSLPPMSYSAPPMAPPLPSYSPAQPVSSYGPPPGPSAYGDSPLGGDFPSIPDYGAPPQQYTPPPPPQYSAQPPPPAAYGSGPSAPFMNGPPQGSAYGSPSAPFMTGPPQGSSYGAPSAPFMAGPPQGSNYGAPPPGPAGGAPGYGDSPVPSFEGGPSSASFSGPPSGAYGPGIDQGRVGEVYSSVPISVPLSSSAEAYRSSSSHGPILVSISDLPLAAPSYTGPLPMPGMQQTLPDSYNPPSSLPQSSCSLSPAAASLSYAPGPSGTILNSPMSSSPYEGQSLNAGPVASSYEPGPSGSYGGPVSFPGPSSQSPVMYSVEPYEPPPAQMFGSPSAAWQDVPRGPMDMPSGPYGSIASDSHAADTSPFSSGHVSPGYESAYLPFTDNGNPSSGAGKYGPESFAPAGPVDVGPTDYVRNMMQHPSMEQPPFAGPDMYGNQGSSPMGY